MALRCFYSHPTHLICPFWPLLKHGKSFGWSLRWHRMNSGGFWTEICWIESFAQKLSTLIKMKFSRILIISKGKCIQRHKFRGILFLSAYASPPLSLFLPSSPPSIISPIKQHISDAARSAAVYHSVKESTHSVISTDGGWKADLSPCVFGLALARRAEEGSAQGLGVWSLGSRGSGGSWVGLCVWHVNPTRKRAEMMNNVGEVWKSAVASKKLKLT